MSKDVNDYDSEVDEVLCADIAAGKPTRLDNESTMFHVLLGGAKFVGTPATPLFHSCS